MDYPKKIHASAYNSGHVQGIAVDKERKYMYFSFTTVLLKCKMDGTVVGSVKGLAGHLGCIAYNYDDGMIYGSLEYKHDSIGKGILERKGNTIDVEDGFYIAIFDVDKIDRIDMDAERDGIMEAVCLKEVFDDYNEKGHRYGCSGIDGVTFAPSFSVCDDKKYLYVAYGIYADTERDDNDHQVILKYDVDELNKLKKELNQLKMHKSGPQKPLNKYFVYTGNTKFGVQNLEYDPYLNRMIMAVYKGIKEEYPNYPMFMIDCSKQPVYTKLKGLDEEGELLSLCCDGMFDEKSGVYGFDFELGSTGIISLGDGYYYFSDSYKDTETKEFFCDAKLYQWNGKTFV